MTKLRRKEKAVAGKASWEQNRKRLRRNPLNGRRWHGADRRCPPHQFGRLARGIRSSDRSKSPRTPRRSISETKVQPAEMRASRAAPARLPTGRVPAPKMSACGVATPAAVLRLYWYEQTHYGQQGQNYTLWPRKEGKSIGHSLPVPGNLIPVYSCSRCRDLVLWGLGYCSRPCAF